MPLVKFLLLCHIRLRAPIKTLESARFHQSGSADSRKVVRSLSFIVGGVGSAHCAQTHKCTVKLPVLHTGQKRARNPGKHQCSFVASQVNRNLSEIICGLQRILNSRIADRRLWTCLLIDFLTDWTLSFLGAGTCHKIWSSRKCQKYAEWVNDTTS